MGEKVRMCDRQKNPGQFGNEMTPRIGAGAPNRSGVVETLDGHKAACVSECSLFTEVRQCVLYSDFIFLFYIGLLFVSGASYRSQYRPSCFSSYYRFVLLECKIFLTTIKKGVRGFFSPPGQDIPDTQRFKSVTFLSPN